jgi:hypothetical protein
MKTAFSCAVLIAFLASHAAAATCQDGAIFKTDEKRPAELILLKHGRVDAPLIPQDPKATVPAFALMLKAKTGAIIYAWGPMRSYTFIASDELLNKYGVKWDDGPLEMQDEGEFFRFMDDSGQEPLLVIRFSKCR